MDNALSVEEISKRLGLDEKTPIVPCVAIDKESARNVMKELQALLQ
jgi:hypothetical protein